MRFSPRGIVYLHEEPNDLICEFLQLFSAIQEPVFRYSLLMVCLQSTELELRAYQLGVVTLGSSSRHMEQGSLLDGHLTQEYVVALMLLLVPLVVQRASMPLGAFCLPGPPRSSDYLHTDG